MRRVSKTVALLAAIALGGCASEPPPKPKKVRKAPVEVPAPEPAETAPVDKSAEVAEKLGVDTSVLIWSPSKKVFAAVETPKESSKEASKESDDTKGPVIAVFSVDGQRQGTYQPPTPGPVAELAFLGEDRLIYLVPPRVPPAARGKRGARKQKLVAKAKGKRGARGKGKAHTRTAPPALPTVTYAIQPLQAGAAPVVCVGRRFEFSAKHDHVAWVVGEPGHEHVAADGVQVYPRQGTAGIQGAPAWSSDGGSLALVQTTPTPQLVVLVEFDNPNGDNTWPLPPEAVDPGLSVFWAGAGTVVVGPALTKPVFAASFKREPNPPAVAH